MKDIIEEAFEDRHHLSPDSASSEVKEAVNEAIHLLDSGKARVAEQKGIETTLLARQEGMPLQIKVKKQ